MRALILFAAALLSVSCASSTAVIVAGLTRAPAAPARIAPRQAELRLDVIELSCHSCAGKIAAGTARIPGVLHVAAAIVERKLVVTYDPSRLNEAALIRAIDMVVYRSTE